MNKLSSSCPDTVRSGCQTEDFKCPAVFKQEEEGSEAEIGFEDLSALTGRVIGAKMRAAKTKHISEPSKSADN